MGPNGKGYRKGFSVFCGDFDCSIDNFWGTHGKIYIEVDMEVGGEMLDNVLEDRDGGNVVHGEFDWSFKDGGAVVVGDSCN